MAKNENQIVGQHPAAEAQVHLNKAEFVEKYPDIYETIESNCLYIDPNVGHTNWNIFEALDFAFQKGRDRGCEETDLYEREIGELKMEIKDLKARSKKLKAGAKGYDNSLGMTTDEIDELEKEIESLKSENEQLKEDNDTLRKNQMVWVGSSGKAIDGLLGQASDTQLVTLLAKRGYLGEISRSERLHDDTVKPSSVGEKIETIKIGWL